MADERRRTGGLNRQNLLIFAMIVAAFFGSALLFWAYNTDALRASVEAETKLSASLLADEIDAFIPQLMLRAGAADDDLSQELDILESRIGSESDVWVVDAAGKCYYQYAAEPPTLEPDALEEARSGGVSIRWVGRAGRFLLTQQCRVIRPLYGGELFLVTLNHADAVRASQRRQFTLLMGVDVLLMLVTLVLVVNTSVTFRRQMLRLATTDELTELANRKSFNTEFAEFIAAERTPEFSLFLLDIDFFKRINDSFGHAAGDHALRSLAGRIRAMTRERGGFAGRWGGDEFIGVLPLGGEEAHAALRRLCAEIAAAEPDDGFRMTISAGVAYAGEERRLAKLTEKADRALYESKEHGRNQASLYRADMTPAAERSVAASAPEAAPVSPMPAQKQTPERFGARLTGYVRGRLIESTILGVKWMAPFVAGGGILIALAFLFDAASVDLSTLTVAERSGFGSLTAQAATLKSIGGVTFNFMLPVFAGFMAYGIAGEEAFMTGFVGGYMTIGSNAGFIGAMLAGFAAGVITNEVSRFTSRLPLLIRKAAPILIYPVFNLLLMQVLSYAVITPLSAAIGRLFTALLEHCARVSPVASGALSAAMMAVDMGGIVNKVAYNYGVGGIAAGHTDIMAAVMLGGMTPPLGIALSVLLFRRKYTQSEQERGVSALFMGLSFITEGALPFVFTDVARVIPACMLGSAAGGLLSELFGCTLPAPHGGMFVLPIMGRPLLYLVALAAGSLVTALALGGLKKDRK